MTTIHRIGAQPLEADALPCPFCGRTDLLGLEPRPDGWLGVQCRGCGCIGPSGLTVPGESHADSDAISHWNRRPVQVVPPDEGIGGQPGTRCGKFHWQYQCAHSAGHLGSHRAIGDDGSTYRWSSK